MEVGVPAVEVAEAEEVRANETGHEDKTAIARPKYGIMETLRV